MSYSAFGVDHGGEISKRTLNPLKAVKQSRAAKDARNQLRGSTYASGVQRHLANPEWEPMPRPRIVSGAPKKRNGNWSRGQMREWDSFGRGSSRVHNQPKDQW